jgi:hypothetical protein
MDKIDKVLLILPLLPIADLLSTLFSINFGGEEVGLLARPVFQNYGVLGLVMLATSASVTFLVFMGTVIRIKKLFITKLQLKWMGQVLTIPIYWLFLLQALYVSTVVMNVLVSLAFPVAQTLMLRILLGSIYFASISAVTKPQMKQLILRHDFKTFTSTSKF